MNEMITSMSLGTMDGLSFMQTFQVHFIRQGWIDEMRMMVLQVIHQDSIQLQISSLMINERGVVNEMHKD